MPSRRLALIAALIAALVLPALVAAATTEVLPLTPDANQATATVTVLDRHAAGLTIELDLAGLTMERTTENGHDFTRLAITDGGMIGAEGQPGLPTITRLVAVPAGVGVQVNLRAHESQPLGAMTLAPILPIVEKGQPAPSFDANHYAAAPRTEPTVTVAAPALLHGLRVVPVTFQPVGYDPKTGDLNATARMTVEITFTGRDDRAAPTSGRLIPESFATLYEQTVIGWQRDASVQTGPGSVIYVCPDNPTVTGIIDELAEWRREQGYNVEVVTTNITGPTNSQIRAWLQTRYAIIEPPLEFVTLVGDANGSVAVPTFNEQTSGYYGEGDHDYSRLDGNDVLADVHVGRISVQTTSQLERAVDKILDYERTPDFSDTDWFTTAGLTGDPATSGYSCIFTNQFVKNQLLDLGYTRIDTIWSGNFASQMMATMNQGETFFTYRGLAGMSGISYNHILSTTNGRQLPFALILTCDTGSFQDDTTSRSEAFLRATNGGGIAAIGTATLGTHTRYNNCYFLGVAEHLLASGDFRFGPALSRGKLNFYINYWQNESNKVWSWSTWNNLMGDPATELWTGVPRGLDVQHPDVVATTAGALPVTVTSSGFPVAGARVAVYQANTVRDWAETDASGQAVLAIDGAATGDVHVTVTGHDLYPYRGMTAVGTVARSLDLADLDLDDSAGNNDSLANPGETFLVSVELINGGTNAANAVTATLGGGPQWVDITGSTVSFGTIGSGASAWGTEPWTVTLDSAAPGGATATLELVASSGGETWTSLLTIPVAGPRAEIAATVWNFPGSSPDPGESGTLSLFLHNLGNLATAGVVGALTCDSQFVDITDPSGAWNAMGNGATVSPVDLFAITVDATCFAGHLANFTLELTYDEGATQTIEFQTTIGTAGPGDPTGPDSYGYHAFSNDDTDPLAPTYDWVELAGGLGANLGLNDDYRWDDETRTIDLPFTFTHYGETYDRVSICSNGWLAFGATYLKFYRGWTLPAAGSPDAMVCAFWDDLAGGEIYTWHDTANHRFIVEWDDFDTWYNGYPDGYYSGNCTFQIILTDPAYSDIDTGDGLIEMQYQAITVSNDESSYFTTGIQDHTRTRGLTYAYGNNYAGGAATLNGGRAIAFRPLVALNQGTLRGLVTNSSAGDSPIPGATVQLVGDSRRLTTGTDGAYSGSVPEGTWDLALVHPSCEPDTARGVVIIQNRETVVNFSVADIAGPAFDGTTRLAGTTDTAGPYLVESTITDLSGVAEYHLYYTSSSSGGPFELPLTVIDADAGLVQGAIPGQPLDTRVQYWLTARDVLDFVSADPAGAPWPCYNFQIGEVTDIVMEDFETGGSDWTVDSDGTDSATSGVWIVADPVGSTQDGDPVQTENDHTAAPGTDCWITGQHTSGESAGYNDVDGGATTLFSPTWDLSAHAAVNVSYWRWYTNDAGSNPGDDNWVVQATGDDGDNWIDIERTTTSNAAWQQVSFDVADFFSDADQLRLRFVAEDGGGGSIVEAAMDDLRIQASSLTADLEAPTVTLTGPDGGEVFTTGQTMTVHWQASDDVGVVEARISLSLDGGQSWDEPLFAGPFDGSVQWTIPVSGAGSTQCRIRVEVLDGSGRISADVSNADFTIIADPLDVPTSNVVRLAQNHPNPFNPRTAIVFSLPRAQEVSLRVYDVQGRLVRTLVEGLQIAGRHEVVWQGHGDSGEQVASGMYVYRMVTGEGALVRKMTLLK